MGFEPMIVLQYLGFQNRCLKPLSHSQTIHTKLPKNFQKKQITSIKIRPGWNRTNIFRLSNDYFTIKLQAN